MTAPSHSLFPLRAVLEQDKLNETNFIDWYRNLRIVLKEDKKDYVLDKVLPDRLRSNASNAVREAWHKHYDDRAEVIDLMLGSMESDFQKKFEKVESPIEIIAALKEQFQGLVRVEKFRTVRAFLNCRLQEGDPVSPHVVNMIGYLDSLAVLDYPMSHNIATNIILQTLPPSFDKFVKDYVDNGLNVPLTELHGLLKIAELDIISKRRKAEKKADREKDEVKKCLYCGKPGHSKRKCKKFLEDDEEIKKMYGTSSSSGIYVIP